MAGSLTQLSHRECHSVSSRVRHCSLSLRECLQGEALQQVAVCVCSFNPDFTKQLSNESLLVFSKTRSMCLHVHADMPHLAAMVLQESQLSLVRSGSS